MNNPYRLAERGIKVLEEINYSLKVIATALEVRNRYVIENEGKYGRSTASSGGATIDSE